MVHAISWWHALSHRRNAIDRLVEGLVAYTASELLAGEHSEKQEQQ